MDLAEELNRTLTLRNDETFKFTSDINSLGKCDRMLLYLDQRTWTSAKKDSETGERFPQRLADDVANAFEMGVALQTVHEFPSAIHDLTRHACDFDKFWNDTPEFLTQGKTNIYRQIALALKTGLWRKAGLAVLGSKLAALPSRREPVDVSKPQPVHRSGVSCMVPDLVDVSKPQPMERSGASCMVPCLRRPSSIMSTSSKTLWKEQVASCSERSSCRDDALTSRRKSDMLSRPGRDTGRDTGRDRQARGTRASSGIQLGLGTSVCTVQADVEVVQSDAIAVPGCACHRERTLEGDDSAPGPTIPQDVLSPAAGIAPVDEEETVTKAPASAERRSARMGACVPHASPLPAPPARAQGTGIPAGIAIIPLLTINLVLVHSLVYSHTHSNLRLCSLRMCTLHAVTTGVCAHCML